MIVLAVIGYSFLAVYEFIPLYKQKLWNDLLVNAILWTASFTIAVLLCLNIKIPSPEKPIREFTISIFGK
ncbi:MAG: hypothetical protein LIR50_22180 [Bacillota bacterium]|nr:hypothetical protein [Bacillota bacterium]